MMMNGKIRNSSEREFAAFCIENVAAKLGVVSMSRHGMSDAYLAEELEQEYAEKMPLKYRIS